MHKWSTLQERPINQSHLLKLLSILFHMHTRTHTHIPLSQNAHLHYDLSVWDCLLGRRGEGKEWKKAAANIPPLTRFLVSSASFLIFGRGCHAQCRVLPDLNGVSIFQSVRIVVTASICRYCRNKDLRQIGELQYILWPIFYLNSRTNHSFI